MQWSFGASPSSADARAFRGPLLHADTESFYILKLLEDQGGSMHKKLSIGAVAKLARIKVPTIRYYEEIGLLPHPRRTDSNRRTYGKEDVRRLTFIRHARELGFDLGAIRQLLALAGLPEEPCAEADEIARARLVEVEDKIARLLALREELKAMLEQGAHGLIRECRVIEILADYDERIHAEH